MSARQQSKRARFARRAADIRFSRKMRRQHGRTPGYLGATMSLRINGVDFGRGALFVGRMP